MYAGYSGVDYGVARACMLGIGVFTGVDFKWLTPNALMSFGSSSSKYCAEVVWFSFVNSKSAGEEKPKFMPISSEPRDATSAHIATTLIRPLPHNLVEPLVVGDERPSSGKFSSCAESSIVSLHSISQGKLANEQASNN